MKTACLLLLTMSWAALMPGTGYAVPELVACPLPWGEGVPRPAFSPAGGGRVRGHWGPASLPTSSQSSAETASGHPRDAGHAVSPRDGRHSTEGRASDERRYVGRPSDPNHPAGRSSLTRTNRPNSLPNSRPRSIRGNALHQPGPGKSPVKGGFIPNKTVHHAMPVRSSSNVQPSGLRGDNMSHRGVNPARVDGGSGPQVRGFSGYPQSPVSRKP
jgi:hypothetical protein